MHTAILLQGLTLMPAVNLETVAIIGGGVAAVSFACALRAGGFNGSIIAVSDEPELAYDRPPLSKTFMSEGGDAVRLDTSRATNVEWLHGVAAISIDGRQQRVHLADGRSLPYSALVLATGAKPRTLPALANVKLPSFTLRTLDDARGIRARLVAGARMVVIGGGIIGLELASTASRMGVSVSVVEALPRLMNRCAGDVLASFVAAQHAQNGVELWLGKQVIGCSLQGVLLNDGTTVPADFVVVGIGVSANDGLARSAEIACDDGIFVDRYGRTTCPQVYAVGDVTRQRNPVSGHFERIETWTNAQNQAMAVARCLLDPTAAPYDEIPYYWSDQYDQRIQVLGIPQGDEELVRGNAGNNAFIVFHLLRDRLVGATCINQPKAVAPLRRLIASGKTPDRKKMIDIDLDIRKLADDDQQ